MKDYEVFDLAATTGATGESNVRGAADTVYRLLPRVWLRNILDAAKKRHIALQFAYQTEIQKGNKDVVVPKRLKYQVSGTMSQENEDPITFDAIDNLCGVAITPLEQKYGKAISNESIRTNCLDLVRRAREDLVHLAGDQVDKNVVSALSDDTLHARATYFGSQAIYGGDATSGAKLAAGDIFYVDMVAEAKRKLQSTTCQYWTYGTSQSTSSDTKNPWMNTPDAPFVLLVAPEQEEALLTDSQFVNASEYGGNEIVQNGEIGKYLGIKVAVSPNVTNYASSATHADSSTTAVAQHRCVMFKSQNAVATAWGQKPKLAVFSYPSALQQRMVLHQAYNSKQVHPDAIVHINVADA